MAIKKTNKQSHLPPDKTEEEQVVTAGQRRINLMWEGTQALIALAVTAALIYVSVKAIDSEELKNAFFLIIGFYFSRTNHTAVGGVGKRDQARYDKIRSFIGWLPWSVNQLLGGVMMIVFYIIWRTIV